MCTANAGNVFRAVIVYARGRVQTVHICSLIREDVAFIGKLSVLAICVCAMTAECSLW